MPKTLQDYYDDALKTVSEISPDEAEALRASGEYLVLDVREEDEYSAGHIPAAINVPRGFLEVKADLVHHKKDPRLQDRNQKVICMCGGGFRSALACKVLQEMGFEEALSIRGGWHDWTESGLPVEK